MNIFLIIYTVLCVIANVVITAMIVPEFSRDERVKLAMCAIVMATVMPFLLLLHSRAS